jgi:DNA-binding NtrC family response regulator
VSRALSLPPGPPRAEPTPEVLVVDDDPRVCASLADILAAQGLAVATAGDGPTALEQVRRRSPLVVILDLRLPGVGGMETLPQLKALAPQVRVIILTGYGDALSAVEAMRLGADDYLTKPAPVEAILTTVRRALERHRLGIEVEALRRGHQSPSPLGWLMGPSPQIQAVIRQVHEVATTGFTILIEGETGTGKELVARAIHEVSPRRQRPFVALDCGAIPETLIESELFGYEKGAFTGADRPREGQFRLAEGGSLFFDEIANLPLGTQGKLLRALQEREVHVLGGGRPLPVDARIIAASNVPLLAQMHAGRFRRDLYYRLAEFVIGVPPLRERREDIPYLARRFAAEAGKELRRPVHGISEAATALLLGHPWPGNVRELRNVIRRAVLVASDVIGPEHLVTAPGPGAAATASGGPRAAGSLKTAAAVATAEAERQAIREALQAARGNKSEAARALGIDYKTLHRKMTRYGITAGEFAR